MGTLKVGAKAGSRDRILSVDEWAALYAAAYEIPYPFGPFTQALMLSAQRISTVTQIRYDEIQGDVWTIPKDKVKATHTASATAHEVPLSKALAALIASYTTAEKT